MYELVSELVPPSPDGVSLAASSQRPPPGATTFALVGAVASVANVLLSVARSKLVAVKVGPAGLGMVAEVTQVLSLAGVIATVASGPALLKWLSEAVRDKDEEGIQKSESGIQT